MSFTNQNSSGRSSQSDDVTSTRRIKIKMICDFFVSYCENQDIVVKDVVNRALEQTNISDLLVIPFFPNEIIKVYDRPEDTIAPLDCLVHVVCRRNDFLSLQVLVELAGPRVLFQSNALGTNAIQFFKACRHSDILPPDQLQWLRQIMTNNRPIGQQQQINNNKLGPLVVVDRFRNYQDDEESIRLIYCAYVHLIKCARMHGFLFSYEEDAERLVLDMSRFPIQNMILEKALLYLPRERWIAEKNALLKRLMHNAFDLVNAVVVVEQPIHPINDFIIQCVHHFSVQEWYFEGFENGFINNPMQTIRNTHFRHAAAQDNDEQNNDDVEEIGFDERVLWEMIDTFPLLSWNKHEPILFSVAEYNRRKRWFLLKLIEKIVNRLVQEPRESVEAFAVNQNPTTEPRDLRIRTSFFAILNFLPNFDSETLINMLMPLLTVHPFLFKTLKEVLRGQRLKMLLNSYEAEHFAINLVVENLEQAFPEQIDQWKANAQYDHPLPVLDRIVGRQTLVFIREREARKLAARIAQVEADEQQVREEQRLRELQAQQQLLEMQRQERIRELRNEEHELLLRRLSQNLARGSFEDIQRERDAQRWLRARGENVPNDDGEMMDMEIDDDDDLDHPPL